MYDHYVAVDWAQSNMAIARHTGKSKKASVFEGKSDLGDLKDYLRSLCGTKQLTIEETTGAQWLFTELHDLVDELIICDPYRNRLLSEGAKNDRIDAVKLCELSRAGLTKPVFHSGDRYIGYRKLVSAYDDLVQRGVRLKNQRSAILRSVGSQDSAALDNRWDHFVFELQSTAISEYERDKKEFEQQFRKLVRGDAMINRLTKVPGIGPINAVKIAAIVVTTKRFPHRNNFLSYCGLIRLEKMSGGRSYGSRTPRHRRGLKCIFKTAALATIGGNSVYGEEYRKLIKERGYSEAKARHAIARNIATAVYGMMKSGAKFDEPKVKKRFVK